MTPAPLSSLAVIMAGGRGARMAASQVKLAKPLVEVRGVSLMERNAYALFAAGIKKIVVAVPGRLSSVSAYARERLQSVGVAVGAEIDVFEEPEPLGSIGCLGSLGRQEASVLLVVNADNLTTLDLGALLADHLDQGADLTVATHDHPFRIPYGEVTTHGLKIVSYIEKPTHHFRVSSAIYALGPRAVAALRPGEPCDQPVLVRRLIEQGARIHAWHHSSPWIDVNDAQLVGDAESLVAAHADSFELFCAHPDREEVRCVVLDGKTVLLEERGTVWDLPAWAFGKGRAPSDAMGELLDSLGLRAVAARSIARFDDPDLVSRRVVRHHVFALDAVGASRLPTRRGRAWLRTDYPETTSVSTAAHRAFAALKRNQP